GSQHHPWRPMSAFRTPKAAWQILNEKKGPCAMRVLPSGEQILISIGSATAKILVKRPLFGWLFPKVIVSEQLSAWQPEYPRYNVFYRQICQSMVLDGLLTSLSQCQSLKELQQCWKTMQNPIAVAGTST